MACPHIWLWVVDQRGRSRGGRGRASQRNKPRHRFGVNPNEVEAIVRTARGTCDLATHYATWPRITASVYDRR
jgi:hypothetical protein